LVGTRDDDATARSSLHQRILYDIQARILSGEWPPGHRIPFEHELTAQYCCSRMTVSKVLTQLANSGLVARRRRAGTFVIRPPSQAAVLEIHDIKAEVAALGLPYRFEILERRRRFGARHDERLRLDVRGPRLDVTCRHFAGEQPFCLEERAINLAVAPEAEGEKFEELSPGAWLVKRTPWTAAENRIRATAADRSAAFALMILLNAPCLVIERRTWRVEEPVTYVKLTYPGDAHELVARFAPPQM
jgi:GntR family transcriptional regulator, histidine utilization repressor